jgi:hypothetical protein
MAEQTPTARTLNYALTGDVMDRVADAAMATENVEVEKMKTKLAATQAITKSAAAFGGAVITGPKKSAELKKKFDAGISRDQFGNDEAYNNYRTSLEPLKEEYIECVRTGDKACQTRILSKVQTGKKFLEKSKEGWEETKRVVEAGDNVTDTRVVSTMDQDALATTLANTDITYETVDGVQYEVMEATEGAITEFQAIDEYYAPDREIQMGVSVPVAGSENNSTEATIEAEKINLVESWINGTAIGEFDFYDMANDPPIKVVFGEGDAKNDQKEAKEMYEAIRDRKVTVKRRFTPGQKEELLKSQTRPDALLTSIEDMQTTLLQDASAEKPTYFNYQTIQANLEMGVDMGNARHLAFNTKQILGSDFGEDFMKRDFTVATGISTDVPVNEGHQLANYDTNPKDGKVTPQELTKVTPADKKVLLEYMLKPENKDVFAKEWSEWATYKLYKTGWEPGYSKRDIDPSKMLDTYTDAYGNVYNTGVLGDTRAAELPEGNVTLGSKTNNNRK